MVGLISIPVPGVAALIGAFASYLVKDSHRQESEIFSAGYGVRRVSDTQYYTQKIGEYFVCRHQLTAEKMQSLQFLLDCTGYT